MSAIECLTLCLACVITLAVFEDQRGKLVCEAIKLSVYKLQRSSDNREPSLNLIGQGESRFISQFVFNLRPRMLNNATNLNLNLHLLQHLGSAVSFTDFAQIENKVHATVADHSNSQRFSLVDRIYFVYLILVLQSAYNFLHPLSVGSYDSDANHIIHLALRPTVFFPFNFSGSRAW